MADEALRAGKTQNLLLSSEVLSQYTKAIIDFVSCLIVTFWLDIKTGNEAMEPNRRSRIRVI